MFSEAHQMMMINAFVVFKIVYCNCLVKPDRKVFVYQMAPDRNEFSLHSIRLRASTLQLPKRERDELASHGPNKAISGNVLARPFCFDVSFLSKKKELV